MICIHMNEMNTYENETKTYVITLTIMKNDKH